MAQQYHALLQDPARAVELAEDIVRNDAELQRADQQLSDLLLRARTAGRVVWPRERDLPGSYAERGAMLGYVLAPEPAQVRLVLRDEDLLRVRGRVRAIEVRLAEAPWSSFGASLANETPAATRQLPSAALGDRNGGPVSVDPADKEGLRTQVPVFLLDVKVPASRPITSAAGPGSSWCSKTSRSACRASASCAGCWCGNSVPRAGREPAGGSGDLAFSGRRLGRLPGAGDARPPARLPGP